MLALLKCAPILEVAFSVKKGGDPDFKVRDINDVSEALSQRVFFTYKTGQSWRRTVKEGLQALDVTGSKLRGLPKDRQGWSELVDILCCS